MRFVDLGVLRGLTFYHWVIIGDVMLFWSFCREEGSWGAHLELCLWRVYIDWLLRLVALSRNK